MCLPVRTRTHTANIYLGMCISVRVPQHARKSVFHFTRRTLAHAPSKTISFRVHCMRMRCAMHLCAHTQK